MEGSLVAADRPSANGTGLKVAPPSTDNSASGIVAPAMVCWPRATTRLPFTATCCSTAVVAPDGSGRTIVLQLRPSVVVHTAGLPSCEPTDTKPYAFAATASTWLEPFVSFTS
jgi:hypothetical protein